MKNKSIAIILLLFISISCKSRKDQTSASSTVQSTQTDSLELEARKMKIAEMTTHRLVVSFISIGEGISNSGKEMVENYITQSESKYQVKIARIAKNWGREGETDFLFSLAELNDGQQAEFINGLRELVKSNNLIQIEENKPVRAYRN